MAEVDRSEYLVQHLTRFLCRAAGSEDVSEIVEQVIRRTAAGHIAIDLDSVGEDTNAIRAKLQHSGIVGVPGQYRPLVLDRDDRLYLHRFWDYERRVADHLQRRAACRYDENEPGLLRQQLDALFADKRAQQQKLAAAVAALRGLAVITGGPGTGKTTAVVTILLLLLRLQPQLRIALAAPTGKAAMRVGAAVRAAETELRLDARSLAHLPRDAATLHRLLRLYSGSFRYDENNRLPYDVVVVDEASMVGVALMAQLLAALPDSCRLILLGDKDQLASVEPGAVLGDICTVSGRYTSDLQNQLSQLGIDVPAATRRHVLQDNVVALSHSFRFAADSGIGQLANAIRCGAARDAIELLRAGQPAEIQLLEADTISAQQQALLPWLLHHLRNYLAAIDESSGPAEVLACFEKFRLLCAVRHGAAGVAGMNALAERALLDAGLIDGRDPWYAGRPVIITRNDYQQHLFNGDVGVTVKIDGESRVVFAAAEGCRLLQPPRLPEHETVYAMTVHKSQGSEFDDVALVLPGQESRVLGRELIYTAVTRARRSLRIHGSATVLAQAIERVAERTSGLAAKLAVQQRPQGEQRSLF